MTEDHYKRLVAMLLDTISAQQRRIDGLVAQQAAGQRGEPVTSREDQ